MSIADDHSQGFVPADALDRRQIDPRFDEVRNRRMSGGAYRKFVDK
jgi:hypothetical protein